MSLSHYHHNEVSTEYKVLAVDAAGRPCSVEFPTNYGPHEEVGTFDDCMVYFYEDLVPPLPGAWFWHGCGDYTRIEPDDIHQCYDVDDFCVTRMSRAAIGFDNRRVRRLLQAGERGRLPWWLVWEEWASGGDVDMYEEIYGDRLYRRRLLIRPGPKTGAVVFPRFWVLRRRWRPMFGSRFGPWLTKPVRTPNLYGRPTMALRAK